MLSSRATRSSIEAKRAALSGARSRRGWVTAVLSSLRVLRGYDAVEGNRPRGRRRTGGSPGPDGPVVIGLI
ncbi:hypothetical protein GCM10019016_106820 [Streptomyces prasinosporus]|uniref:Transposase n=1 Tax=Streptomyces prasinosporus TaxID=68256 RepID=A0ABP6U787_9ACTN